MVTEEELTTNPFLLEWHRKVTGAVERGELLRAESVVDVLGEKEYYALAILRGEIKGEYNHEGLASQVHDALAVFWTDEMVEAATQIEIPRHTVAPDACPISPMWWSFPSVLTTVGADGGVVRSYDALLIQDHGEVIEVDAFYGEEGGMAAARLCEIRHREVFPKEGSPPENFILAMLTFMQSPLLAEVQKRHLNRADRRRVQPEYQSSEVNYVTLRRRHYRGEPVEGDGEGHEYNVRWIVSGHLRAQWYPSLQAHKLIWIAPYVKGPDSAPLKKTVYKVVR